MNTQNDERDYPEYLYSKLQQSGLVGEEVEHCQSLYRKLFSLQYVENGRSSTKEKVLEQLLDTAEKIDKSSIEGALSSAFIYHQIVEEWMYDLLELMRFFIDLKLYPDRIKHRSSEKMKLNALIDEIESSIDFVNKVDLIKTARLVNQERNSLAHDLLKKDSLEALKKDLDRYIEHFNRMYDELGEAQDYLLGRIKWFRKWSDGFYDKHISFLTEILEEEGITHFSEGELQCENSTP